MKVSIDAMSVLKGIVAHPEAFKSVAAELHKAANSLVAAQLKKAASADQLVAIERAVGREDFGLVLESLPDAAVKTLAKKIDPHCPELKTALGAAIRTHLVALAAGAVVTSVKPQKTPTKKAGSQSPSSKSKNVKVPASWPQSMVEVAERKKS